MKKTVVAVFVLGLGVMTLLPFFYEDEVSVVQNRIGLEEEQDAGAQFAPLPIFPSPYKRPSGKRPLFASLRKSLKKAFTAEAFKETQYDDYGPQEQENSRQDNFSQSSNGGFDSSNFYEGGSYDQGSAYDHSATRRRPRASSAQGGEEEEYIQQEPSQGVPVKGIHNISTDERAQEIFDSSKIHEEIMNRVKNSSKGQVLEASSSAISADAADNSYYGQTENNTPVIGSESGGSFVSEGDAGSSSYRHGSSSDFSGSLLPSDNNDAPVLSPQFETAVAQTEEAARNHKSYFKSLKDDMHNQMRENSQPRYDEKDGRPPLEKPEGYDPSKWQKIPDFGCGLEEGGNSASDDIVEDIKQDCNNLPNEKKIKVKIDTEKEVIINAGALENGRFFVVAGENALGAVAINAAGGAVKKIDEKDTIDLSVDNSKGNDIKLPRLSKEQREDLDGKGLLVIAGKKYREWSRNKDFLVVTGDEAESQWNRNAVFIDPQDLGTYSGLQKAGEEINAAAKRSEDADASAGNEGRLENSKKPNSGKRINAAKNKNPNQIEKADAAKNGNINAVKK